MPRNRKGSLASSTDFESSSDGPGGSGNSFGMDDAKVVMSKGKKKPLSQSQARLKQGRGGVRLTKEQQARLSVAEPDKPLMNRGLVESLQSLGVADVRLVIESEDPSAKNETRLCSLDEAVAVARDEVRGCFTNITCVRERIPPP